MNFREWHRHLACSELTGWKPVPLCSRRRAFTAREYAHPTTPRTLMESVPGILN